MRKLILILVILLLTANAFSQNVISGFVKDETNAFVPFATLKFRLKGSTDIKVGKIVDDTGRFVVAVKDAGNYVVDFSATGYKDTTIGFEVTSAAINLELYVRREEKSLKEFVVTANSNRPMIQRKIDRVIMNVSNNPLAGGKSSLELMNLAPGVFVNSDGAISINGNNGTRVMVNGKLLQLSGGDLSNYLSNLRAEDIESVEVVAHPPAQYDAQGTGGMINIVLKKNRKAGLSGTVNAGYTQGVYGGTNEGISLNYNSGKLTLFGNYSYNYLKSYENTTTTRNNNEALITTNIQRINRDKGNMVRFGGTYDINKKQYLGIEYNGSFRNHEHSYNSITDIVYPHDDQNQSLTGTSPVTRKTSYHNVSINYHLNTDTKGSELEALADYTHNTLTSVSSNHSVFYDYYQKYTGDTAFGTTTPSAAKIFTADLRYKNVLSKVSNLSFGTRMSITSIDNSAENYVVVNEQKVPNLPLDFNYKYSEDIYAGYINFNTTFLKTEVQIGLRGEYTKLVGVLRQLDNNQRNPNDYFNLFPSVFLKRNLNKEAADYLTFSYNRRLERPSFSDLNPYQYYVDYYTLAKGNPYLTPSYSNSFELSYTLKNKYTASVFLDVQDKMIGEYFYSYPDSLVSVDMRENFGTRYNYGISFSIPVTIAKWWSMQNNITLRHVKQTGQGYVIEGSPVELQSIQEFKLPKSFAITVNGFYRSKIMFGNFVITDVGQIDAGIQKKLFHNKLLVRAAANDVFKLMKMRSVAYYTGGAIHFISDRQWQTFNLSLVYNFSVGKVFKTRKLESSSKEVKSRL
jgi:iron complex outermembrane recepter protein